KDAIGYDAFGNIISETDSTKRGRYAWTGRELDTETGLQYNRARYYDAKVGRWLTQDPLGFDAGDSNLYRYVHNQAVLALDPSGTDLSRPEFPPMRLKAEPDFFLRRQLLKLVEALDANFERLGVLLESNKTVKK